MVTFRNPQWRHGWSPWRHVFLLKMSPHPVTVANWGLKRSQTIKPPLRSTHRIHENPIKINYSIHVAKHTTDPTDPMSQRKTRMGPPSPVINWSKKIPTWQFCWWPFLGWWKRDPFKRLSDLQRSGMKRSRIESPGMLVFLSSPNRKENTFFLQWTWNTWMSRIKIA